MDGERTGYRALRRGRIDLTGCVYFVTTVTRRRTRCFDDFETACIAARTASATALWTDARLLAWVLMPDHWHGLIELHEGGSLSRVVRRFKGVSSRAINAHLQAGGALWMAGFHDRAIRGESAVRAAARYLVANPLRAGLVSAIGDYPFWDAVWL